MRVRVEVDVDSTNVPEGVSAVLFAMGQELPTVRVHEVHGSEVTT